MSDRGHGISEDKLKEVFDPFFIRKAEGRGMGLYIARTIIEARDGLIVAKNREHGGASFRIRLPLSPMELDAHSGRHRGHDAPCPSCWPRA